MPRHRQRFHSLIRHAPETVESPEFVKSVSLIGRTGLTASSWLYLCSACHNEILWKIPHNPNMKTEITLAIVLLACGFAATHMVSNQWGTSIWSLKSAQVSLPLASGRVLAKKPIQQEHRLASNSITASPDRDANHNYLIKNAAKALRNSSPLKARLRYKINLFGEQISGPGMYFQKGQGTRLSRMQFEFGFDQSVVQIHQFCDGDKLYTLSIAGDKSNLEFVDLRKLDSLQKDVKSSSRVSSWLSVGSLTGLMEQLSTHFVFTEVEQGSLDKIPVVICTGQWNPKALRKLLDGQPCAKAAKKGTVRWQQLPEHLPHQVKLTLGLDQKFPYFPYRIVFEQFVLIEGKTTIKETAVLELFELKQAIDLPDEIFSIPSTETVPTDSTEFYRRRILQFTR